MSSMLERSGLSCFLFIYLVSDDAGSSSYCTVVSCGRDQRQAEQIAINRVHQQGLHIVRTDTATAAPWLNPTQDEAYLAEMAIFGSALKVQAA
ncbi:MAG: hypothetical protein R3E86_17270 [Pseudomonadales bacterium]